MRSWMWLVMAALCVWGGRCWQQPWQRLKSRFIPAKAPQQTKRSTKRKRKIQVVIDIDDTVKSTGNVRFADVPLGGIDGQYDRGAFYPGVFEFVAELCTAGSGDPEPVAVLTARARELKFLELSDDDKVCRAFKSSSLGTSKGWGIDVSRVMYGSLHEWLFQDFKAWRKYINFELLADRLGDLAADRPSREFVFIGDTGEMDRQAGELILSRHPKLAKAVFLHCVGPAADGSDVFVPVDYAVGGGRVYHFRTYVGAAAKACKAGYLDRRAFERVVAAALLDVQPHLDDLDSRNRRRDIDADIRHGRALLDSLDHAQPPEHADNKLVDFVVRLRRPTPHQQLLDDDFDDRVVPVTNLVPLQSSFWRSTNTRRIFSRARQ